MKNKAEIRDAVIFLFIQIRKIAVTLHCQYFVALHMLICGKVCQGVCQVLSGHMPIVVPKTIIAKLAPLFYRMLSSRIKFSDVLNSDDRNISPYGI